MLFEVLFDGKVRASTSYLECIPTKNTLPDMEHASDLFTCDRLTGSTAGKNMMNLIHYNNFADHIKNTYKSDCTIYLENNGQMELMVGAEISDQLMEQYLKYVGPKYIVSESQLPLMVTENIFSRFVFCTKAGPKKLLVVLSTEHREAYEGDTTADIIRDIREFREGVAG